MTRLDELPSRFLDTKDHATPIEALMDNTIVKELINSVPEAKTWFFETLSDGKNALNSVTGKQKVTDKPNKNEHISNSEANT